MRMRGKFCKTKWLLQVKVGKVFVPGRLRRRALRSRWANVRANIVAGVDCFHLFNVLQNKKKINYQKRNKKKEGKNRQIRKNRASKKERKQEEEKGKEIVIKTKNKRKKIDKNFVPETKCPAWKPVRFVPWKTKTPRGAPTPPPWRQKA